MERAAVLATEPVVTEHFFRSMVQPRPARATAKSPSEPASTERDLPLTDAVEHFERRAILHALDETNDNKAEAARRLGISERNLWYKLKKHGL
jgi:DNA-binding NtrC family response regulator